MEFDGVKVAPVVGCPVPAAGGLSGQPEPLCGRCASLTACDATGDALRVLAAARARRQVAERLAVAVRPGGNCIPACRKSKSAPLPLKTHEHPIREKTATRTDAFHLRRWRSAESIRDHNAPASTVGAKFYPVAPAEQKQSPQKE